MKNKKAQLERLVLILMSFIIGIMVAISFVIIILPTVLESFEMVNADKTCIHSQKVNYCEERNMELSSKVITPTGLFGGPPYNHEICKSKYGELLIEHNKLDWKRCKLK